MAPRKSRKGATGGQKAHSAPAPAPRPDAAELVYVSHRRAVRPTDGEGDVWHDLAGFTSDGRPIVGPAFAEDRVACLLVR